MKAKQHEEWRKGFPYYKVQYWDAIVTAWHDMQKHFRSVAEAKQYGSGLGKKYRIMQINRQGRKVI